MLKKKKLASVCACENTAHKRTIYLKNGYRIHFSSLAYRLHYTNNFCSKCFGNIFAREVVTFVFVHVRKFSAML